MDTLKEIQIFIDGASRGNPGPSSVGVIAKTTDGRTIEKVSAFLGKATNNVAEFNALILGLKLALKLRIPVVKILSDSQLLVRQMTGEYKIKSPNLRGLAVQAHELIREIGKVSFEHVPREENREADKLANDVLNDVKGNRGIIVNDFFRNFAVKHFSYRKNLSITSCDGSNTALMNLHPGFKVPI